jgi:hypothetical protein
MKPLILIPCITIILCQNALACSPEVQKSNPPRLINGEWVQTEQPNATALAKSDFEKLQKKNYAFVFSGTYSKEASFSKKPLSYIKTKKIWRGNVPEIVDVEMSQLPTDNLCSKLKYDQEYIFFASLGNRNDPIQLKSFRKATLNIKKLLGKPIKQWLRGRLIKSR